MCVFFTECSIAMTVSSEVTVLKFGLLYEFVGKIAYYQNNNTERDETKLRKVLQFVVKSQVGNVIFSEQERVRFVL